MGRPIHAGHRWRWVSRLCLGLAIGPVVTACLPPWSSISAENGATCGIRATELLCWGLDDQGRVSDRIFDQAVSVDVGVHSACALDGTGEVGCWGGLLVEAELPEAPITSISVGVWDACGIAENGALHCWGTDLLPPPGAFSRVSLGSVSVFGCALDDRSRAACWGDDRFGEALPPTEEMVAISAGGVHACGIKLDGSLICWGDPSDGKTAAPEGSFVALDASSWNTCAVREDGAVLCWGHDEAGQSSPPAGVYESVAAGGAHSCAIEAETGDLRCWGSDRHCESSPPPSRCEPER